MVQLINGINNAVCDENVDVLISLLKNPSLKLALSLHKEEYHLYMRTLKKRLLLKEAENLWLDDIIKAIDDVNDESIKVKEFTEAIVEFNSTILRNDVTAFWELLNSPLLCDSSLLENSCRDMYFQMFSKALKKKGHNICPWIVCHTEAGNTVYIDMESFTYSWTTPKDFVPYARYLTKKDILSVVEKTNKHHINTYKQKHFERTVMKFQAHCKGFLIRQRVRRHQYLMNNVDAIVTIQSWWRQILARRKYGTLIKMKAIEAKLKRERQLNPLVWYKVQVRNFYSIIRLQDFFSYLGDDCATSA